MRKILKRTTFILLAFIMILSSCLAASASTPKSTITKETYVIDDVTYNVTYEKRTDGTIIVMSKCDGYITRVIRSGSIFNIEEVELETDEIKKRTVYLKDSELAEPEYMGELQPQAAPLCPAYSISSVGYEYSYHQYVRYNYGRARLYRAKGLMSDEKNGADDVIAIKYCGAVSQMKICWLKMPADLRAIVDAYRIKNMLPSIPSTTSGKGFLISVLRIALQEALEKKCKEVPKDVFDAMLLTTVTQICELYENEINANTYFNAYY